MTKRYDALVVGGGIAGILAALILNSRGLRVCIIEGETHLGGLLKSFKNERSDQFDYGTHFIAETGVPELDSLLLKSVRQKWPAYSHLKVATFMKGKTNATSSYIKPQHLPQETYLRALEEFKNLPPTDSHQSLADFFTSRYGPTLTDTVLAPIIYKLYRRNPSEIDPEAARIFQLQRLILFSEEEVRSLKKDPWFDSRLAYHDSREGTGTSINYYPQHGGAGTWIELLTTELKEKGVDVILGGKIASAEYSNHHLTTITLQSGEQLEFNYCVWTAPPKLLANLIDFKTNTKPPEFVKTTLYFLVIDTPYKTDSFYLMNYDDAHQTYRVTLFDNFSEGISGRYRVCVEGFCSQNEDPDDVSTVLQTLTQMGVAHTETAVLSASILNLKNGFPIFTNGFITSAVALASSIESRIHNIVLCGKASGKTFFMTDTLRETYSKIAKIIS